MPFVIQTPIGFVHSINDEHVIVVTTNDVPTAKKFLLKQQAQQFINEFGDCGMGLDKATASIKKITVDKQQDGVVWKVE